MSTIDADDLVTVVDLFQAAWPWQEWTEKTIAVWLDGLADPTLAIDGPLAVQVARRLTRKWPRCESLAAFLAEYRNEAERYVTHTNELEAGPVDVDRRSELLVLMRERLSNPKPHDHHRGWEGCSTCVEAVKRDGLNPPPSKQHLLALAREVSRDG